MSGEKQNHKAEIYEDKHFVVNGPYNACKEFFNTERWEVRIYKENGDVEYFVKIREKKDELGKD